jgi:hypothetical protein
MSRATIYAYLYLYPDGSYVRLITRTTLELIKALRSEGVEVLVLPDDGTPIYYLIRKGEASFLADPVIAYLVNIPTSIIASLVAALLFARGRDKPRPENDSGIVFHLEAEGKSLFYSETGAPVSEAHAERVIQRMSALAENLMVVSRARFEDPEHRFPICLEHTDKIIGWTHLEEDANGLKMKDGKFLDDSDWDRIDSGEFRGFSVGGIVSESTCSICGSDYSECNHISGLEYDGEMCVNTIKKSRLSEVSLVRDPVNKGCLIDLQLRKTDSRNSIS